MTLAVRLAAIPGLGLKRAQALVHAGVKSVDDLRKPEIKKALPAETRLHLDYPVMTEIPWEMADRFAKTLPELMALGSYRRKKPIVHDIDMFTSLDIQKADQLVSSRHKVVGKIVDGGTRIAYIVEFESKYIHVDLFYAPESERAAAIMHWTGSVMWNIRCRYRAKKLGYKLNEKGLWRNGKHVPVKTEEEILEKIGITWRPPEQRN